MSDILTKYTELVPWTCTVPVAPCSSPVQTLISGSVWAYDTDETNNYQEISFSAFNTVSSAIKTDGTLWLWGVGQQGQLGSGSANNQSSPVQTIAGGTNWKQVSLGGKHTAAVKTDGTLWTWGTDCNGQLGRNSSFCGGFCGIGETISGGTDWKQVSAGYRHTAAIKTDGSLWTWGYNPRGQLGDGTFNSRSSPVQTVSGGTDWKQVSSGFCHTAAIKTDGSLWLWGESSGGRLGDNDNFIRTSPVQTVAGGNDWKQVSASNSHTAAIKTDGTLWAWGSNTGGRLGDGTTVSKSSPVQTISGGTDWKQVSLGSQHSSATKTDGTLWLWGYGRSGRLGNGSFGNHSSPVQTVGGGNNWKQASAGCQNTLAVKSDNTLWIWGYQLNGALGLLADQTCALDIGRCLVSKEYLLENYPDLVPQAKTPALWIWGSAQCGRLGDNTLSSKSSPVQTVAGGTNWKQVSSINPITAAVKTDGTLWLWGRNTDGQLGDNTIVDKSSPVQTVAGGTNWKQVAVSYFHVAAVKTDGTLWTWGKGVCGALGNNAITNQSSPVQTVAGGTNWKQVDAGHSQGAAQCVSSTHAIKCDGSLWAWGTNYCGVLGTGNTTNRSSPVQVAGTNACWKQVTTSGSHTLAIKNDNTLWSWGLNCAGQLLTGNTTNRTSPALAALGGCCNWKQVSAARSGSVGVKTTGELYSWGVITAGDGNPYVYSCNGVQTVSKGTNWFSVATDSSRTSAIKTDGTLWTWGYNANGQLGDGTTISRSSPVQTIVGGTNWKQVSIGAAIAEIGDW